MLTANATLKNGTNTNSNMEQCSYPQKHDLGSTLLRFDKALMITDESELNDSCNQNNYRATDKAGGDVSNTAKAKSRNSKIRGGGITKAFPLRGLCMEETTHIPVNDLVQKIHSPRVWEQGGKKCRQMISNACTTRSDVIALKQALDLQLQAFGVDQIGLCRKRRECFAQCFDEIIRQVSMGCVERGQLLMSVRDELNKNFVSYESLFCSAIAYGITSQMKVQKNTEDWREKINEVKERIIELESVQDEFFPAYEHFKHKFDGQLDYDNKQYYEEYERLLRNHEQLKELLLHAVKDPLQELSNSNLPEESQK